MSMEPEQLQWALSGIVTALEGIESRLTDILHVQEQTKDVLENMDLDKLETRLRDIDSSLSSIDNRLAEGNKKG